MSRILAYVCGAGLVTLVVSPAFRAEPRDSYPLSTYPMFAQKRDKPLLYFVLGIDKNGRSQRLPPEFVSNDEVMQAAATVRRAVNGGPIAERRLCEQVAQRVSASHDHATVTHVAIVGARFDPLTYFENSVEPEERAEHFRCVVRGRS